MIERTITQSDKMRIIDYHCRIVLGEFLGRELVHEVHRVSYIPLGRCGDRLSYFAELDAERQAWILSDSNYNRCGEFAAKSQMTRWVRKRLA